MNSKYTVLIESAGDEVLDFASDELRRCLDLLPEQAGSGEIKLAVHPRLISAFETSAEPHPYDDAIDIAVIGGNGTICGSNSRSVLIAVYRYLQELGCRFLFPGRAGELFPTELDLASTSVVVRERPRYRHRGVCIEGANSIEGLIDAIDFLPKQGMNSYFIQFQEAYTFFKRWYRHEGHPHAASKEEFTVDEARRYTAMAVKEIARRGLIYHAVGHGWTCEPLGIPGYEWHPWKGEIASEVAEQLAEIDGRRELFHGVPLNTSLCYSRSDTRRLMVTYMGDYVERHPDIDILHVWLADGSNNQCECENCRTRRPADWYIMLLNEIDAEFDERGIDIKVCFIIYSDLLWPPLEGEIRNPERFVMMFAPISRTYREPFYSDRYEAPPEYHRNRNEMPRSVAANLGFYRAWDEVGRGDSLIFDYHYMWAHYRDIGGVRIATILGEDINNLESLNFNGYMSCQVQRAMAPNAMGFTVMARTLWGETDTAAIIDAYFADLYGAKAAMVLRNLQTLSDLSHELNFEDVPEMKESATDKVRLCEKIEKLTEGMLQRIDFSSVSKLPLGGRILEVHLKIWHGLATALRLLISRECESAETVFEDTLLYMWQQESDVMPALDCFNFNRTIRSLFQEIKATIEITV